MPKVYLSLGSNIGDKFAYLKKAIENLKQHEKIEITKYSSLYETAPVGYLNQDNFINQVIELSTSLLPYELLSVCQMIENKLERKRTIRFGPRTIDIDILLYDDLILNDENLTIPHPRMYERAFVLVPLFEINKDLVINNSPISYLVDIVSKKGIKKIPSP